MRKVNEHTIIIQSSVNEQQQFLKKKGKVVFYSLKCLYTVTHLHTLINYNSYLCAVYVKPYIFTLKVPAFIRPCRS